MPVIGVAIGADTSFWVRILKTRFQVARAYCRFRCIAGTSLSSCDNTRPRYWNLSTLRSSLVPYAINLRPAARMPEVATSCYTHWAVIH